SVQIHEAQICRPHISRNLLTDDPYHGGQKLDTGNDSHRLIVNLAFIYHLNCLQIRPNMPVALCCKMKGRILPEKRATAVFMKLSARMLQCIHLNDLGNVSRVS
uniref:DNA-directed RNA polymerase n=1 Tax=Mesocestoides corti TaxID=53468 RepID=A0A5K3FSW9_MESCO